MKKRHIIWESNTIPPRDYIWIREGKALEYSYVTNSWEESKHFKYTEPVDNSRSYWTKQPLTITNPERTPTQFGFCTGGKQVTIEYKLNDGEWTKLQSHKDWVKKEYETELMDVGRYIVLNEGDSLMLRSDNDYLEECRFIIVGGIADVSGNIMSLLYGQDFTTAPNLKHINTFTHLFSKCNVRDASNLILPIMTLAQGCYSAMFMGCQTLTAGPELPATTLASECYYQMFAGCELLKQAPILPAKTLVENCYAYMFHTCVDLQYIKCCATNWSMLENYTTDWVANVGQAGTFVGEENWTYSNDSGIPLYWDAYNLDGVSYVPYNPRVEAFE